MGLLDHVLASAGSAGEACQTEALAALLGARATGGSTSTAPQPEAQTQPHGGLLGGLGGLIQRFEQSGHSEIVNSWIGSGQNRQITRDQLHQALGPEAVNNLRR